MRLENPQDANLLALILHRLLSRTERSLPKGRFLVCAGRMKALAILDNDPRVVPGEGEADCRIEAELSLLTRLLTGEGYVKPWLSGKLRVKGLLKARKFLLAIQCS